MPKQYGKPPGAFFDKCVTKWSALGSLMLSNGWASLEGHVFLQNFWLVVEPPTPLKNMSLVMFVGLYPHLTMVYN